MGNSVQEQLGFQGRYPSVLWNRRNYAALLYEGGGYRDHCSQTDQGTEWPLRRIQVPFRKMGPIAGALVRDQDRCRLPEEWRLSGRLQVQVNFQHQT